MQRALLLGLTFALPFAAPAQASPAHPLVGQWDVSIEMPLPPGSGAALTINRKGTLSVAQAGDSMIATITMVPVEGLPTPQTQRLAAAMRAGKVSFARTVEATLQGGNEALSRSASMFYDLEAKGTTLAGEMRIELPGVPDIPARPITGTRAR